MRLARISLALLLVLAGNPLMLVAQPEPHVRGSLVAEVESAAPGESFDVLFRQDIDPGWHTYWLNPGDSGAPPDITWQAPEGVTVGEFNYPFPERIPYGPLMNYGYHDRVDLPFTISLDESYTADSVTIEGSGRVLVCADICIPEKITLQLVLPVGAHEIDAARAAEVARAWQQVPVPVDVPGRFTAEGDMLTLTIGLPVAEDSRVKSIDYFPFANDLIDNPAEQRYSLGPEGITLELRQGFGFDPVAADVSGVLVVHEEAGEAVVSAFAFKADTGSSPVAPDAQEDPAGIGLLTAALFAFLGGLILNLMPCVFPVLSIKVLSLVDGAHRAGESMRMHGWAYTGGVVLSFVAIALLLIMLRLGGEAIGWGFQLQSPVVVGLLAYLFLLIGLNLLGVFEIGTSVMSLGQGSSDGHGYAASAATGVLATVVAAPCTAPFMGAAVGYALTQSSLVAIVVFASLGFGMAVPFLALSYAPGLLARLPKPGRWMEVLRQVLAFPMFASAVWLAWVLGLQTGVTGMMQLLAGGLLIAFAIWLLRLYRDSAGLTVKLSALLLFAGAIYLVAIQQPAARVEIPALEEAEVEDTQAVAASAGIYSPDALEKALRQGPVFVNFTAAWCITCKVNELNSLSRAAVQAAFREKGVTYLKADWTNEDPVITAALQEYGRSGVPLYLLYRKQGEKAEVLPQLLTEGIVLQAISDL